MSGPVVSGPVVSGPVVSGPVVSGPVVSGAVVSGPVVSGAVAVVASSASVSVVSGPVVSGPDVSGPDVSAGPVLPSTAGASVSAAGDRTDGSVVGTASAWPTEMTGVADAAGGSDVATGAPDPPGAVTTVSSPVVNSSAAAWFCSYSLGRSWAVARLAPAKPTSATQAAAPTPMMPARDGIAVLLQPVPRPARAGACGPASRSAGTRTR